MIIEDQSKTIFAVFCCHRSLQSRRIVPIHLESYVYPADYDQDLTVFAVGLDLGNHKVDWVFDEGYADRFFEILAHQVASDGFLMHDEIAMIHLIALRLEEAEILLVEIDEFCFAVVLDVGFEEGSIQPVLVDVVSDNLFLMGGDYELAVLLAPVLLAQQAHYERYLKFIVVVVISIDNVLVDSLEIFDDVVNVLFCHIIQQLPSHTLVFLDHLSLDLLRQFLDKQKL